MSFLLPRPRHSTGCNIVFGGSTFSENTRGNRAGEPHRGYSHPPRFYETKQFPDRLRHTEQPRKIEIEKIPPLQICSDDSADHGSITHVLSRTFRFKLVVLREADVRTSNNLSVWPSIGHDHSCLSSQLSAETTNCWCLRQHLELFSTQVPKAN